MLLTTPIMCKSTKKNKTVKAQIQLDTGAGGLFMDEGFAQRHDILLYPLDNPIFPQNIDGTLNAKGDITYYTWI